MDVINRKPWNLIVGFGGILAVFIAVSVATSCWVLVVPFAVVVLLELWRQLKRAYSLITRGYHSRQLLGASRALLRYEELHNSNRRSFTLKLENTEPGHYELFVRDEAEWSGFAPDWAQGRRLEIAERIAETWRRDDVHVN